MSYEIIHSSLHSSGGHSCQCRAGEEECEPEGEGRQLASGRVAQVRGAATRGQTVEQRDAGAVIECEVRTTSLYVWIVSAEPGV